MSKKCPMAGDVPCIGKECIFSMGSEIPCLFIESYRHSLQASVRISPYLLANVSQAVESGALHYNNALDLVDVFHRDILSVLRMLRYLEDNPIFPKAKQRKIREMRLKLKQEVSDFCD